MRIRRKLLLANAIPATMIWVVGYHAMNTGQQALRDTIAQSSTTRARAVLDELDRTISIRIDAWVKYTRDLLLQRSLEASNNQFAQIRDLRAWIDDRDTAWKEHPTGTLSPLMNELQNNELAKALRALTTHTEESYGFTVFPEVFVTNRYGANVAQTNRTSDYRQDDERWWTQTHRDGLYVADVEYDDSSGVQSVAICVRIDDEHGDFIGVLKALLNIGEVIAILDSRATVTADNEISLTLLSSDQRIIHSTSRPFTPLDEMQMGESQSAEGVLSTVVESHGFGVFKGLGWILHLKRRARQVLAPVNALQRDIFIMSTMATLLALFLGGYIAYQISIRIRQLANGVAAVGRGEHGVCLQVDGNDEVSYLVNAFNKMSDALLLAAQRLHAQVRIVEEKNTLLEREVTERKQLECQLVQAQKLESIGQLAAGIAHEINTPTQYVSDNTCFLKESFGDIAPLLEKAEKLAEAVHRGTASSELADELKAGLQEADVEYLAEQIPLAIGQSLNGIDRVRAIVQSMKEFSHPGVEGMTSIDLNHAIQSTITVATSEWKQVADLKTDFDPELPPVSCLPGEFNQVVLNMLVNAAHAIGGVVGDGKKGKGTITISTRRDGEFVEVRIADTGTGIPEEARGKIFDPFFTTKEVGKGTGQGLSIAHCVVVQKHGGTLAFETEIGKGTTFIIRLPLENQISGSRGRGQ